MNMARVLAEITVVVVLVCGTTAQRAPPAASAEAAGNDAGLVAHWPLDETSGRVAADRIGGDNNGTLHGKPSATLVKGLIGSGAGPPVAPAVGASSVTVAEKTHAPSIRAPTIKA